MITLKINFPHKTIQHEHINSKDMDFTVNFNEKRLVLKLPVLFYLFVIVTDKKELLFSKC